MPFIGGRLQIYPGYSHLYKSREIAENCGVRLSSQTHIISIKCTSTRQILVLFSSSDTTHTIFFVLWKDPIAQSRVSPISLLVVGYEETCHAVTTLPFILRVFFLLFEYIFLRISRLKFAKFYEYFQNKSEAEILKRIYLILSVETSVNGIQFNVFNLTV